MTRARLDTQVPHAGAGRTLLVAATGGHLTELVELQRRVPALGWAPLWFVPQSGQSEALLHGHEVVAAPDIHPRAVSGLPVAAYLTEGILRMHRVDCVVSTGSGVAVASFAAARMHGIACHYIESAARVEGPSATGRLLQGMPGVHLWSQHEWAVPGRWARAPSVFDGFTQMPVPAPVPSRLKVVVTLGTMKKYGFRRLVEHVVRALPSSAEVLWQTGATDVSGLGIDAQPWLSPTVLDRALRQADLVIAHAGVGSALTALDGGVCPVLVPRRRAHGEHVDDHQAQLAAALAARGLATSADPEDFTPELLIEAARRRVQRVPGAIDDLPLARSRRW